MVVRSTFRLGTIVVGRQKYRGKEYAYWASALGTTEQIVDTVPEQLRKGGEILLTGANDGYDAYMPWPDAEYNGGQPLHRRGVTDCPASIFLGCWLYKRKSAFLRSASGAEDAAYLAEQIAARK